MPTQPPSIPNVAYLAAELASSVPALRKSPHRAALLAMQLCSLGRRYQRSSERLANGLREPTLSRVLAQRAALFDQVCQLLAPYRRVRIATGDLVLRVLCFYDPKNPSLFHETALR